MTLSMGLSILYSETSRTPRRTWSQGKLRSKVNGILIIVKHQVVYFGDAFLWKWRTEIYRKGKVKMLLQSLLGWSWCWTTGGVSWKSSCEVLWTLFVRLWHMVWCYQGPSRPPGAPPHNVFPGPPGKWWREGEMEGPCPAGLRCSLLQINKSLTDLTVIQSSESDAEARKHLSPAGQQPSRTPDVDQVPTDKPHPYRQTRPPQVPPDPSRPLQVP